MRPQREPALPRVSRPLVAAFSAYAFRYVRRHLHAVRIARDAGRPAGVDGPLMIVLNHPAWWDPLVGLVLARRLFADREHYAPIEAEALARYAFFARLGFFGLDPTSAASARGFLRTAAALLERPRATLWITAQGRFADARERPVVLREGVGHVARRMGRGVVLPLAIEYAFWTERTPEALVRFGEPLATGLANRSPADWTATIGRALEVAQDALAADVLARDPERFDTIVGGAAGVGGIYDLWRAARARLRGESFRREHGGERR